MQSPGIHQELTVLSIGSVVKNDDNLIVLRINENAEIGIPQIDEIEQAINQLTCNLPHYLLVVPGFGSHSDRESREYAARQRKVKQTIAEAIVVQNLPLRILANFYAKFNKPSQLIKLFPTEEEALEWLREMKKENEA